MNDVAAVYRGDSRRAQHGTSAARIIVRLMAEVEHLRRVNAYLRIALTGCEFKPQSPFPLVSGEEVIAILHPAKTVCHRR
jgi:hypothetical protein